MLLAVPIGNMARRLLLSFRLRATLPTVPSPPAMEIGAEVTHRYIYFCVAKRLQVSSGFQRFRR